MRICGFKRKCTLGNIKLLAEPDPKKPKANRTEEANRFFMLLPLGVELGVLQEDDWRFSPDFRLVLIGTVPRK